MQVTAEPTTETRTLFRLVFENDELKSQFESRKPVEAVVDGDTFAVTVKSATWLDDKSPLSYSLNGVYVPPPGPPPPPPLPPNATQQQQMVAEDAYNFWEQQQQAARMAPQAQENFQGGGVEITILLQRIDGILRQVSSVCW